MLDLPMRGLRCGNLLKGVVIHEQKKHGGADP